MRIISSIILVTVPTSPGWMRRRSKLEYVQPIVRASGSKTTLSPILNGFPRSFKVAPMLVGLVSPARRFLVLYPVESSLLALLQDSHSRAEQLTGQSSAYQVLASLGTVNQTTEFRNGFR